MLRTGIAGVLAVVLVMAVTGAQDYQPTCRNCPATYIGSQELQAYITRAKTHSLVDQQVRALDIGKINAAVGIVHRGKLAAQARIGRRARLVGEADYIIDGAGDAGDGQRARSTEAAPGRRRERQELNGPGNGAASIRNGVSHQLKTGDVIVIPAGTGQGSRRSTTTSPT